MKKSLKYTVAVMSLALCCTVLTAIADEPSSSYEDVLIGFASSNTEIFVTDDTTIDSSIGQYVMEMDKVYELDLEGDGQTEQIYYKTYENSDDQGNCNAVLEIYNDGQLFWSYTDQTWSYYWDLSQFILADGATYLLACSHSDNDWTSQALVLSKTAENDAFTVLADLTDLTRESEEHPDNLLSGWARTGYAGLLSVDENTLTVPWTENTKCTGNIAIYVDYEIADNAVTQLDAPFSLDEERTWTAWYEFDVFEEPGSTTPLFHVAADDVVTLTEITKINDQIYLKCVNSAGQEGWFPDAAEYVYTEAEESPEGFYQGYFKECIFAG